MFFFIWFFWGVYFRCRGVAGVNVFRKSNVRLCVSADNRMCVIVLMQKETNLF